MFPGSAVSAFGVVTHFCREAEARAWVADDLIPNLLPAVIEAAIRYVDED